MADLKKKVENLTAPTRKAMKVTTKWEVPSACLKSAAKDSVRFDGQDMLWVFDANPKTQGIKKGKGDVLARDASNKNSQKTDTETIPRKSFYPLKGKPKLVSAEFWIRGYNYQGTGANRRQHYGPWVHRELKFAKPAKPSLSITYDDNTGRATVHYETAHPDGAKECYDTVVSVTVHGSKKLVNGAYTATQKDFLYEVPQSGTLAIGAFRKVTATAYNRGFAGASDKVTATRYVYHPNPPVCGTPTLLYATANTLSTASIRVPCSNVGTAKDKGSTIRPSQIKLQRLKNYTSATNAAGAASEAGWTDVATDNGSSAGLSDTWANAVSDAGKYTWYRYAAIRDGYTTYGVPKQAKCINVPDEGSTTGRAQIATKAPGADGKSIVITLSGKQASDDGYEVSWSDASDAWQSTEPPSTFETAGSTLVIKGLTEGTEYYMKARAYDVDADGVTHYGQYGNMKSETPITTPSTVVLDGARTTPRGSDLALSWTYDTEAAQRKWRLTDSSGKIAYSGKGAACNFVITPEMYGDASSLTYAVEMTTGGGWAKSAAVTFAIADPPTCAVTMPSTLTAQPMGFTVESDEGDDVRVVVTALGSSGTGLHGDRQQFDGDTVHAAVYTPEWTVDNGTRTAAITLPTGLVLFDGAVYRVDVTAIDADTGLESAVQSSELTIAWAHKAQQPPATATASQADKSVLLKVNAPTDYQQGDRFDLYRVTGDGERRIASSLPFGTEVNDRMAPFSHDGQNLRYIAVTRTADGDSCVSEDIGYTLKGGSLRFDWNDVYVELPYNLKLEDSFSNDAETRKHLDGESEGYAESGYSRTASLSTDLIRFEDAEQQEMVRAMLQHPGSVFVRTPDGLAFAATVTPGTISRGAGNSVVGIDMTATEHALTDDDRPGEADISVPQWGGGAVEAHNGVVYDSTGGFPMDEWVFIGYGGQTLYVCDPEGAVRDGDGDEMADWTYDGLALYDDNGDEVEVTEEPEE